MSHTFLADRGALTVTTAAFFAAHPFPKGEKASGSLQCPIPWVLPPWGSGPLLSPKVLFPPHRRVLCQVLACRWREGLKCDFCAPSHLVASPRRHSSPSRPTSQTASPWAAQWACGSSQSESTTSPSASPQCPKAVAFVVRRPTSHNCVIIKHFRLPRKKELGFIVPRHAKLRKRLQLAGSDSSHLCRTRVSAVVLFQHWTADHQGEPALHVDGPLNF